MNCVQLAKRVESLLPGAPQSVIARWCTVILNIVGNDSDRLDTESGFASTWNEANIRLNAAIDQHDATTSELENLARSDPKKFSPEQIWILVRALKVQSQLLQLYTNPAPDRARVGKE